MMLMVCVSYGGEFDELCSLFGYVQMKEVCVGYGVIVYELVMSLIGMVNVGKGVVIVGFVDGLYWFE